MELFAVFRSLDSTLLHFINQVATAQILDSFFLLITNLHKFAVVRFVLLPALIFFAYKKAGPRALKAALVLAITVGACDLLNHRIIKPLIGRDRPFLVQSENVQMKLPYTPGGYSFPSNHAVNTMAGVVVLSSYAPQVGAVALGYAFLVGYSRPYLGVHYPSDILSGWLLGWAIAAFVLFLIRKLRPSWAPQSSGRHGNG